MSYVLRLREIKPDQYDLIGPLARNIVNVHNIGLSTPVGFCVTNLSFKNFLTMLKNEIDEYLRNVNKENNNDVTNAVRKVQELILKTELPYGLQNEILKFYTSLNLNIDVYKSATSEALNIIRAGRETPYVILRPSTFSTHNSLTVKGNQELIRCVKKIWADSITNENVFDFETLSTPVLIQKMLNPDKSGYLTPGDMTTIKICLGFNDHEQVYDTYLVDKNSFEIINKIPRKQSWFIIKDPYLGGTIKKELPDYKTELEKLDSFEIQKLVKISNYLKENLVNDIEIEFSVERDNVHIINIKEFTGGSTDHGYTDDIEQELKKVEENIILKGVNASPGVISGKVKVIHSSTELAIGDQEFILVCSDLNGIDINNPKIIGIVTDNGISNGYSFSVPTVLSTNGATSILKDGQNVTIDGTNGVVYDGGFNEKGESETVTEIKVNVSDPKDLDGIEFDGIGLFRSEKFIIKRGIHPFEYLKKGQRDELVKNLVEDIISVAKLANNKNLWYRTFDALSSDFKNLEGGYVEPNEVNPLLGWRSIRRDLSGPELLKIQFEAIKKVQESGYPNIGIMIPMITDVSQVKDVKEILRQVGLEPQEEIDFGIMVETPAAVQMIKKLCKTGLDFICIGIHDLAQLTLGVDMKNPKVSKWFDVMHPAVLHQILYTIKICREHNIEVSVAGDFTGKTDIVDWLVSEGIESISSEPQSINEIRAIASKAEKKMLLKVARNEA